MAADREQCRDIGPDLDDNLPPSDYEERQRVRPSRMRRLIGGLLVVSSLAAGTATTIEHPQEVAIELTQAAADSISLGTPIGLAARGFDAYMTEKAGWDHPIYTEFKSYRSDEHPTPKDPLVTNFIFTGLREMHGEEIAREISYATDYQYPVRYQENGNQPISADYMAEQLIKSLKEHPLDTPYIGFTCHSMGGIMLIETLDRLHQLGYKLPKIAFIDFFSTPSGMQTARFGALGNFITKAKIGRSATGALISSIISQMQAQNFDPSWWKHDVKDAYDELPRGASPALTMSQMEALDQIDSLQTLIAKLKQLGNYISKYTKFRYFGPANPNSDQVVNEIQAHQELAYAVYKVFRATMPYYGFSRGHAQMNFIEYPLASTELREGEKPSEKLLPKSTSVIPPSSQFDTVISRH